VYHYCYFINAIFAKSNTIGDAADRNYLRGADEAANESDKREREREKTKRKLRSLKSPYSVKKRSGTFEVYHTSSFGAIERTH